MNTARKELCKELYELSGWRVSIEVHAEMEWPEHTYPLYDLGSLLRKLPPQTRIKKEFDASLERPEETPAHYRALYDTVDDRHFWLGADTPEDAACKLAIELFKHGVLS